MHFDEVLSDLILSQKVNIQDVSYATGIDDSVFYDYLNGSVPSVKYAVELSMYFECSLDYLMGIDETLNSYKYTTDYNISLFPNRYENLLKENNVTHYKVCKETGLSYSGYFNWKKGAIPSMLSLKKIAKYFNVSLDYLVGRTNFY